MSTRAEQYTRSQRRAALEAVHGPTFALPHDLVDETGSALVVVYGVMGEAAAKAYAAAEAEFGNEAKAEEREGAGWVVVTDLRPQIAAHRAETMAALTDELNKGVAPTGETPGP